MDHDMSEIGPPPPELEDRVVGELWRSGLLESAERERPRPRPARLRTRWRPWALPLAALLAGAVLGWGLTRQSASAARPASDEPLFVLMYSGGPQEGEELVHDLHAMGDWVRTELDDRYVGGQKLRPEGTTLVAGMPDERASEPRPDDFTPIGFVMIRARDLDEAAVIARSSPHLELGGHVVVRPVDDLRWVPQRPASPSG